ncbi:hypothetical protein GP486_008858 [Trichoglossum hirsutum]|uniref:CAP-Gly domain-containing protein n=1 Tax=Trichoglossum hirsutum TaxID=265104 RepID=A0A9P8I5E6_9PEZI|nr:hypothetical protein GP486_008858 [Trichoglossum hirsutum]
MPSEVYASRSDSVLAWKRRNQLGRFDPSSQQQQQQQPPPPLPSSSSSSSSSATPAAAAAAGITLGARCRIIGDTDDNNNHQHQRRGTIAYIGPVDEIPSSASSSATWVGIRLDEPLGKNDGSLSAAGGGRRYFDAGGRNRGVFVRPDRVEVGEFPVIEDYLLGEQDDDEGAMEEI